MQKRIQSVDVLRGLVMVIMALDHTRDFFHSRAMVDNPLNLETTTVALFFTRFITHYCAPVFVFLSGTSAYLQRNKKSKAELSSFLMKRGLWLIFVEIVVINFLFSFDPGYHFVALQVIWSIGISMIILGLMVWLPLPAILVTGLVIVLGHDLLDAFELSHKAPFPLWYDLIHHSGGHALNEHHNLFVMYPFLPWAGLMMLGYCVGVIMRSENAWLRRRFLIGTGLAMLLFFIVVRWSNFYGDPAPWSSQSTLLYTFLSFINVSKYPPSLLYICITIGPALIFLALFENTQNAFTRFISVYGRVPFFYYVLHFALIHSLSTIAFFMRGHSFEEGWNNTEAFSKFSIPGEGYPLAIVYLIWAFVFLSLYPLCKWYDRYRAAHKEKWWLSYL